MRSMFSSEQLKIGLAPSSVSSLGPDSHLPGPYRLADPVHLPHSQTRRLQADDFYGVQGLNISEGVLLSTKASGKCDRGTQTDVQEDNTRPDPESNPFKTYFAELMLVFTIHSAAAIAAGITLNLTSWGVLFGLVLGFLVSVPTLVDFSHDLYCITKHLEPTAAKRQSLGSSHSMISRKNPLVGGFLSTDSTFETPPVEMTEFGERPRQREQDSYMMHGALPPVVREGAITNTAGISSSSTQIGSDNEKTIGTEGGQPLHRTRLSSNSSLSDFGRGNSGRESPDLYGATPPQVETPQPVVGAGTAAEVDPLQMLAGAASEGSDRENDGRLYNAKHQDTEGDIAVPELMHDRALTTSLERSGPVPKRTWTK